jgi:hypothetical protein
MKRTMHVQLDIEGALRNADQWKGCIKVDGIVLKRTAQVRKFLQEQLALGRKVLPCSDECVGFDYITGCPGHVIEDGDAT